MTWRSPRPSGAPVLVQSIEVSAPIPAIPGAPYRRARVLVRCHGHPCGVITMAPDLAPEVVANLVFHQLGDRIAAHYEADGLAAPSGLTAGGLPRTEDPPCSWQAQLNTDARSLVSVIVPTCGPFAALVPTVDSLLAQTYAPIEVIVVDNRPATSDVAASLAPHYGDRVVYVAEPRRGSSRARNAGALRATGAILAFADDDVVIDPDWVGRLVLGYSRGPDVGCVTGLIMPAELETDAQLWLEEFGGFAKGSDRRLWNTTTDRLDHPLYPYTVGVYGSGANCSFRRGVWSELGGFDPALGGGTRAMAGEDIDLLTRHVEMGGTIAYEPAAIVWHAHGREREWLVRQVWAYGVGLSAMLTKRVVGDAQTRGVLLRHLLPGARHTLSRDSTKNAAKSTSYPRRLTIAERAGMLYGPIAYMRSRRVARRIDALTEDGRDIARPLVDAAAIVATVALAVLIAANVHSPAREVLALAFITFVPGWALLPPAGHDWAAHCALTVGISLGLGSLLSAAMLAAGIWGPTPLFAVLAIASGLRLVPRVLRSLRVHRPSFGWGR